VTLALDERLIPAVSALDALVDHADTPAHVQWQALREIQDVLAVTLLSLHPLRYQKPKWVIADLEEIGRHDFAFALLRSYGATSDDTNVSRTYDAVKALLAAIARERALPSFDDVLARGFVQEFPGWSYACRTLADAESLRDDGAFAASDYTAKFAARLAISVDADAANGSSVAADAHAAMQRALFGDALDAPPADDDLEVAAAWLSLVMNERARAFG
jgi:hypothetical protein